MSWTMTMDQAQFGSDVRKLMALTNKTMNEVLEGQGKLFVRDAMRFTPPFGDAPITEALKIQKKAGEGAIMHDLLGGGTRAWKTPRPGLFVVIPNTLKANSEKRRGTFESRTKTGRKTKVKGAADVLITAQKDGTILAADIETWRVNATLQELLDHHAKFRSQRNGRVTTASARTRDVGRWKFIDKWVITQTQFNRIKKFLFDRVGLAKSGWIKAGRHLGLESSQMQGWITRNTRGIAMGIFKKEGTGDKVRFTIGNAIPYVQRFADHVYDRAWKNRLRNFSKQVEKTAKALERKLRTA